MGRNHNYKMKNKEIHCMEKLKENNLPLPLLSPSALSSLGHSVKPNVSPSFSSLFSLPERRFI